VVPCITLIALGCDERGRFGCDAQIGTLGLFLLDGWRCYLLVNTHFMSEFVMEEGIIGNLRMFGDVREQRLQSFTKQTGLKLILRIAGRVTL
jgi:hypothetical protein